MQSQFWQKPTKVFFSFSILFIASIGFAPTVSNAEVIQLPEKTMATPPAYSVTLPGRGMSMTEVIDKFGEPEEKQPEVGEPPITRWVYPNYMVIFEYQYVIHSVSTNKPMGLMKPEDKQSEPVMADENEQPQVQTPADQ